MLKKITLCLIFLATSCFAIKECLPNSFLFVIHGTCAEKGNKRTRMEDQYFPLAGQTSQIVEGIDLFGVYDGHCVQSCNRPNRSDAANFVATELPPTLIDMMDQANQTLDASSILQTYQELDRKFCMSKAPGGTTVVTAIFKGTTLWIANAGDAEAVACFNGKKARVITQCHTADCLKEFSRINNIRSLKLASIASAKITKHKLERFHTLTGKRTVLNEKHSFKKLIVNNHRIVPTRGIGDEKAKPFSIPDPYTSSYEITEPGFLILASDGLWDTISYQAAVNFVLFELAQNHMTFETITHEVAQEITNNLVQVALELHDHDNVTATIIFFNPISLK